MSAHLRLIQSEDQQYRVSLEKWSNRMHKTRGLSTSVIVVFMTDMSHDWSYCLLRKYNLNAFLPGDNFTTSRANHVDVGDLRE